MAITVKFVGALRHFARLGELSLDYNGQVTVRDLVNEVVAELPEIRLSLTDPHIGDPSSKTLMLVNGREISVLSGLETELKDGDEVVFVPFVHGG